MYEILVAIFDTFTFLLNFCFLFLTNRFFGIQSKLLTTELLPSYLISFNRPKWLVAFRSIALVLFACFVVVVVFFQTESELRRGLPRSYRRRLRVFFLFRWQSERNRPLRCECLVDAPAGRR